MAGGVTGRAAVAALNYMTGTSLDLGVAPQTVQLALLTAAAPVNPTVDGLNEVASTGYIRQDIAFSGAVNATPGQPSVIANAGNVLYGPFTAVNGLEFPATHCALIGSGVPVDTANLMDANTAGVETDATGWGAWLNCAVAQSVAQFHDGAASLEVTVTAAGDAQSGSALSFAVDAHTSYLASAWVYSVDAGVSSKVDTIYYDAEDNQMAYASDGLTVLEAATWTQVQLASTAPEGATLAKVVLRTEATGPGQVVYYDTMALVPTLTQDVLMTWQFDAIGQAAQNESLQVSAGALTMSLG